MRELALAAVAGFKGYFDFISRASRSEFWYFMVFFFALYLLVAIIDELFLNATLDLRNLPLGHYLPMGFVDPEVGLLVLLYRPVMALPTLAITVRRLHDVGKSGWWSALWLFPVPVLGWFYLVPLLSRPSQD